MQMTVYFRGAKVGGLNRRINEWYLSKVFVSNHGGQAHLERRGFRYIDKNESHQYWALKGPDAVPTFAAVIHEMTRVDPR
jgi:hypothetical protein